MVTMRPDDAVIPELISLMRSAPDQQVVFSQGDLVRWPSLVVSTMQSQRLIIKASPAEHVVCDGCEESCFMPVETVLDYSGGSYAFVVCDKRDDINRVPVTNEATTSWKCGVSQIAGLIRGLLGLVPGSRQYASQEIIKLGTLEGMKGRRWVNFNTLELSIEINGVSKPVEDVLFFDDKRFVVDQRVIAAMVDSSSSGVSKRYVPSTEKRESAKRQSQLQYQIWHEEYLRLKKLHPNKSDTWISQQIAKLPIANSRSADTIRKNMK